MEMEGFNIDPDLKGPMWREGAEQAANMMAMTPYPGFEGELTGAELSEDRVVCDGKIITSRGPGTALAGGSSARIAECSGSCSLWSPSCWSC